MKFLWTKVLCTLGWLYTEGTYCIVTIEFGYILCCVCFNLYCGGFIFFVMCVCFLCVGFVICEFWYYVICMLGFFGYTDWDFSVIFLSCKANARVKPAKIGHGQHYSKLLVIVLFCCYLCCSMYCPRVNVYCTTTTGYKPNYSWQIYNVIWSRCCFVFWDKQKTNKYRVGRMYNSEVLNLSVHIVSGI